MENIILSKKEGRLLKQHKRKLEFHFGVKINVPELIKTNCSNDVIVATICGETKNRDCVKKYLQMKMNKLLQTLAQSSATGSEVPVITLSESDSDSTVLVETQNKNKKSRRRKRFQMRNKRVKYPQPIIDFSSSKQENKNSCQVARKLSYPKILERSLPSTAECLSADNVTNKITTEAMDDSVVILSDDINPQTTNSVINTADNLPLKRNSNGGDIPVTDDSIIILSEDIHTPSTSYHKNDLKESSTKNSDDVSFPLTPEFLSLRTSRYAIKKDDLKRKEAHITLTNTIPQPIAKARRVLRPVVIDGSNVAREHGKVNNTFSCKGIKISIEYFLQRGHTQVTALLPSFRKHCRHTLIPTTDQNILEELEKTQNVVFTPSRHLNGRRMTCYDDRFIVDLASKTEGVILSNDNYRDIMDESPHFKKTIEERLLMFCFVGDIIMIPEDPLGRYGPKLDAFLSMKESNDETQSSSSTGIQMSQGLMYRGNEIQR